MDKKTLLMVQTEFINLKTMNGVRGLDSYILLAIKHLKIFVDTYRKEKNKLTTKHYCFKNSAILRFTSLYCIIPNIMKTENLYNTFIQISMDEPNKPMKVIIMNFDGATKGLVKQFNDLFADIFDEFITTKDIKFCDGTTDDWLINYIEENLTTHTRPILPLDVGKDINL